jgi:hypothetical protein
MGLQLYANDFTNGAFGGSTTGGLLAGWSTDAVETTPSGLHGRFLGQFGNDSVDLTLENLPPKSRVELVANLYIIRSWDGNNPTWGPDIWRVEVLGGPVLLETTFSNGNPGDVDWNQSYPDPTLGGDFPARTNALENDTLGYQFSGVNADSVYPIDLAFDYVGSPLTLRFTGQNLQAPSDESWGLDEVGVVVTPI